MTPPGGRISGANPVFEEAELVFGLVGPVGTNFTSFQNRLAHCLKRYSYKLNEVRVSELIRVQSVGEVHRFTGSEEFVRLSRAMHAGNLLRLSSAKGEFLALSVAKEIHGQRPQNRDGVNRAAKVKEDGRRDQVLRRTVHVVRSLKHPDEVRALRRIYGSGFFLLGLIVDEERRREYLRADKGCTADEIERLLRRDEHEEDPEYLGGSGENYGQRMRDTFHLSDAFLQLGDDLQLERFLALVFGDPFRTPTVDEHAMFLAFAASLRSGDLSRQVGAVAVSRQGDVIATGANDVPRASGGLYWPGDGDKRDHALGEDSNEVQRSEIIDDVLTRLTPDGANEEEWLKRGRSRLAASRLMDLTEYGRAVHAEMEALMSCARSGSPPTGGTLFSTTFPCHNCAKHIVAAGVARVVYVEPYPKSQAKALFGDSIRLGDEQLDGQVDDRVVFEPFKGVGPRRFLDLFSMSLSSGTTVKRKRDGKKAEWSESSASVRVPMNPNTYIDREIAAATELLEMTSEEPGAEGNEEDRP